MQAIIDAAAGIKFGNDLSTWVLDIQDGTGFAESDVPAVHQDRVAVGVAPVLGD